MKKYADTVPTQRVIMNCQNLTVGWPAGVTSLLYMGRKNVKLKKAMMIR